MRGERNWSRGPVLSPRGVRRVDRTMRLRARSEWRADFVSGRPVGKRSTPRRGASSHLERAAAHVEAFARATKPAPATTAGAGL